MNYRCKFVELQIDSNKHPLIEKENSLAYYIRKYLKSVEGYAKLISSGSSPGKLYGMAKVHKANVPLRPVVSMIGTPEYELSKFLDSFVKWYIPVRYLLKSTDHFIEKLKQFPFSKNQVMVTQVAGSGGPPSYSRRLWAAWAEADTAIGSPSNL